jgi:octaheme c-type cytochrome (tetrathionate reductase family)
MRALPVVMLALVLMPITVLARSNWPTPPVEGDSAEQVSGPLVGGSADHGKFKVLKGPFATGPEVTKACLSCHTEAGQHFMKNIHWTWDFKVQSSGQQLGKKHLVNNFCTNARGNEGMCAQCHAGYGWKDETFDFTNENNIDCLVCHDQTGTYYKTPNSGGNKACAVMFEGKPAMDLARIAQQVGLPERANCGICHFNGGGGDNVKHGDLSSALQHPPRDLDIHMSPNGQNFACTACHVTKNHVWAGSRYEVLAKDTVGAGRPGQRRDVATCESCHGIAPHRSGSVVQRKLNHHVPSVACQTCHIPSFARGGVATVVDWDWRTAGKTKNGEGYHEHGYTQGDGEERYTYKSIKGSFTYAENVIPEYGWFDGQMRYTTVDTHFDINSQPIPINAYQGTRADGRSRIWPFKRMHTWQPFDTGNGTLVYTHLWGDDTDAYWGNYDMGKAIARGMKDFGLDYSGQFGFLETVSYWPITHMVAPKENALGCRECHSDTGRLGTITGVYLPGRDRNRWIDLGGMILIIGTVGVALAHGLGRRIIRFKNRRQDHTGGNQS